MSTYTSRGARLLHAVMAEHAVGEPITEIPVTPNPDLRGMPAEGSEFGNGPFAVYVTYPTGQVIRMRNHDRESAIRTAHHDAALGKRVHVSLDTCG